MTDLVKLGLALQILRDARGSATHKACRKDGVLDRRCDLCRRIDEVLEVK